MHGDEVRLGGAVLHVAVSQTEEPTSDGGQPHPDPIVSAMLRAAGAGDPAFDAFRRYELVRELGRGGQGVVYLARHTGSGELVALKLLLAHVAVDPSARFGFLREFENIRALRHANIVEFLGSGVSGSEFYFTCEYCAGGSVDQLVARRGGTLSLDEAVPIVLQALDGLRYAHQAAIPALRHVDGPVAQARGLVHRDIKPSNILLSGARPVAKLADFGLAKAFDQAGLSGHTRTGAVGGTIPFMARPQLINYKFAGPEVDVWAVAACLYWMLTGATPRDFPVGKDPVAVALREPSVRIRERGPSVPPRMAAVIDEALVDKPRITIATADELALALRDAL
ncbi:MAG: serine/threonine-protein kinase [Pseudonocardiaceae bacterium]